jgi:reversibly glycosylated polypeptide / UDP-arabinopyranose mutase
MTTIVIASNREESMHRWLDAWRENLKDHRVILVEDNASKTFSLNTAGYSNFEHYAWDDIDRDLDGDSWVIPRRTSAIKSYGFLKAKGDITWTLDDDCFPEPEFDWCTYTRSIEAIMAYGYSDHEWTNTLPSHYCPPMFPRGYPYEIRKVKPVTVWHGVWSNIPDLDGVTALKYPEFRTEPVTGLRVMPYGKMFPMCGMNLAFKPEMLPVMYFMLQGHEIDSFSGSGLKKLPFDRFDDIWAGLFVKKTLDRMGWLAVSGGPSIVHTKESDPQMRVEKEAPGIEIHEKLWKHVEETSLKGCTSAADCYTRLGNSLEIFGSLNPEHKYYWYKLARAMRTWTELTA